MDKIQKFVIGKIKAVDEEKRTVDAVVSDETIDRYGEVILLDAWKKRMGNYKAHGPLLASHNARDLLHQIGKVVHIGIQDDALVAKFEYFINEGNPQADWAWKLATKFKSAAFSVGFLPFDWENGDWSDEKVKQGKKPSRTYKDVELLEISQVTVPANPAALVKSLDGIDSTTKCMLEDYAKGVEAFEELEKIIEETNEMTDLLGDDEIVDLSLNSESDDENEETKDLTDETVTKPDTENYIHIAAPGQEGKHSGHKIKTITISSEKGIKAHYCLDDKVITGYMFDTKKWTHDEAAKWVKEHADKAFVIEVEIEVVEEQVGNDTIVICNLLYSLEQKIKSLEEKIARLTDTTGLVLSFTVDDTTKDNEEVVIEEETHENKDDEQYLVQLLTDTNERLRKSLSV